MANVEIGYKMEAILRLLMKEGPYTQKQIRIVLGGKGSSTHNSLHLLLKKSLLARKRANMECIQGTVPYVYWIPSKKLVRALLQSDSKEL